MCNKSFSELLVRGPLLNTIQFTHNVAHAMLLLQKLTQHVQVNTKYLKGTLVVQKFKALRQLHIVFYKPQRFYQLADSACSTQVKPMYGAHFKGQQGKCQLKHYVDHDK